MTDKEEQELILAMTVEAQRSLQMDQKFLFAVDLVTLQLVVAQLQLALRHPSNNGIGANASRQFIDDLIAQVRESSYPATAKVLEMGNDPAHDKPADPASFG